MELEIISPKYGKCIVYYDEQDYEIITNRHWMLVETGNQSMPVSEIFGTKNPRKIITMHSLIFNNIEHDYIVHIDGNKLNNCRNNLLVIPPAKITEIDGYYIMDITSKTHGNKTIFFDKEDYCNIIKHKWAIAKRGKGIFYAITHSKKEGKTTKDVLLMHQLIMPNIHDTIDHKNHNGLDNRKDNLRKATKLENIQNSRTPITNTSGYKGVSYYKPYNKWRVQIVNVGIHVHGGYFEKLEDAAKRYNELAKQYYGNFAYLNIIQNG